MSSGLPLALGAAAALALVSGLRRRGGSRATTPLPPSFPEDEIGLMTREAFLRHRNPGGKFHASDTYDSTVESLNLDLYAVGFERIRGQEWSYFTRLGSKVSDGVVIYCDNHLVGVVHEGTLFHGVRPPLSQIPRSFWKPHGGENAHVDLGIVHTKQVKYPVEYVGRVSTKVSTNRARFPHVLRNLRIAGETFQVRAERPPQTNKGETLVVLNGRGEIVAEATDEWGATLFRVAREYRGKGLATVMGPIWYQINPVYGSGGFTQAGQENALRIWEMRVREFVARGWYSALVREGRLTLPQVRAILEGLPHKARRHRPLPADPAPPQVPPEVLVYAQDSTFVVYDARFLTDPDERWIYGYGFFRDAPRVGVFLYSIEYERRFAKLVTYVALQMAKDEGDRLYVGEGYGDVVELDGLPHVKRTGDYVTLTKNVLLLKDMARLEHLRRKPYDRHGEMQATLLETAEGKWAP